MCCVPNKGNMAQSNQIRNLQHTARITNQSKKRFTRIRVNPESTCVKDKTRSNINNRENKGTPTGNRGNNNQHNPPKASRYIREGK